MIDILDLLPENNLEKEYLGNIALFLREKLFEGYYTGVYPRISQIVLKNFGDDFSYEEDSLVLMNADEQYRIPSEYNNPNVKFVFKQYSFHNCNKMLGIPLGCPSDIDFSKNKKYEEKNIDVSFIGQIGGRNEVLQLVNNLTSYKVKSFLAFTNGFNNGLNKKLYSEILMDSKIIVCPRGASSYESFRLYEAAKSGAIVLCVPQPNNWIYANHPFVVYHNFEELLSKILFILEQSEVFQAELSYKCWKYYEDNWEPEMVGQKILNFIIESKYLTKEQPVLQTIKPNFLNRISNFFIK